MKCLIQTGLAFVIVFTSVAVGQSDVDYPLDHKHYLRDASAMRLRESPVMNLPEDGLIHLEAGTAVVFFASGEAGGASASMMAGVVLLESHLYIEGGWNHLLLMDRPMAAKPIMLGVRGIAHASDEFNLGLGYRLYTVRPLWATVDESAHWIYTGFAWNPGNNTYVFNIGPTYNQQGRPAAGFTIGMNFSLGYHVHLILDLNALAFDDIGAEAGLWTGFRWFNDTITLDLSTYLLFGYSLKVGLTL